MHFAKCIYSFSLEAKMQLREYLIYRTPWFSLPETKRKNEEFLSHEVSWENFCRTLPIDFIN